MLSSGPFSGPIDLTKKSNGSFPNRRHRAQLAPVPVLVSGGHSSR